MHESHCRYPCLPRRRPQCYNALDRNVAEGKGDRVAFYWEGNDVGQDAKVTYKQALDQTCQVRPRTRQPRPTPFACLPGVCPPPPSHWRQPACCVHLLYHPAFPHLTQQT